MITTPNPLISSVVDPAPSPPRTSFDADYLAHNFQEPPNSFNTLFGWDIGRVREVCAEHEIGEFFNSWHLWTAMSYDPTISSALTQLAAPLESLPKRVVGSTFRNTKGQVEAARAEQEDLFAVASTSCPPEVLADTVKGVAGLGMHILQVHYSPSFNGARLNPIVKTWPLRASRWNQALRKIQVMTMGDGLVTIEHGDGKWIIVGGAGFEAFRNGAVMRFRETWPDIVYGRRDRSQHSEAHGQPKPIGTLPEGVAMSENEKLTFAGKNMLNLTKSLSRRGRAYGIQPFGAKVEYFEPKQLSWQIFKEITAACSSDIAKVLLGQDSTTSDTGAGENYIKAGTLYDVRQDIVKAYLGKLSSGFSSGLLSPWSVINYGSTDFAAKLEWLIPNVDEDARQESLGKRIKSFSAAIAGIRSNGLVFNQEVCNRLQKAFGIEDLALLIDPNAVVQPVAVSEKLV